MLPLTESTVLHIVHNCTPCLLMCILLIHLLQQSYLLFFLNFPVEQFIFFWLILEIYNMC